MKRVMIPFCLFLACETSRQQNEVYETQYQNQQNDNSYNLESSKSKNDQNPYNAEKNYYEEFYNNQKENDLNEEYSSPNFSNKDSSDKDPSIFSEIYSNNSFNQSYKNDPVSNKTRMNVNKTSSSKRSNSFSGAPVLKNSKKLLAEDEAPQEYIIQAGDTLFDICDQLIDEPSYWPKLWSLNTYIKNPNFLWPGMRISFYPGSDDHPPYIDISEDSSYNLNGSKDYTHLLDDDQINIAEKKSKKNNTPKAKELKTNSEVEVYYGKSYKDSSIVSIPGFVLGTEIDSLCEVDQSRNDYNSEFHQFICSDADLRFIEKDKTYNILRKFKEIEDPNSSIIAGNLGILYIYVGKARMKKVIHGDRIIFEIISSGRAVRKGDLILPYYPTEVKLKLNNPVTEIPINASIIAYENGRKKFGGAGNKVYINRGHLDGVLRGQLFGIRNNSSSSPRTSTFQRFNINDNSRYIGFIYILDTTNHTASALITESKSEIHIGDMIGPIK